MKSSFKQIIFVLSGLGLVALAFFFNKLNSADAAKSNGKKFGEWTVNCIKTDDSKSDQQDPMPFVSG